MRAGVLHAGWFGFARPVETGDQERRVVVERLRPRGAVWNASRFASEQIKHLVGRVFDESVSPPMRQVVFTSIDADVQIQSLCERIARTLASLTTKGVALINCLSSDQMPSGHSDSCSNETPLQLQANLWQLAIDVNHEEKCGIGSLHQELTWVRHEFEYSIVAARPGALNEAVAAARAADGAVLVLSAMKTRRASAAPFLSALTQVRLLGTLLIDREFPMPEAIYRRL